MDLEKLQLMIWKLYPYQPESLLSRGSAGKILTSEELAVTVLTKVSLRCAGVNGNVRKLTGILPS